MQPMVENAVKHGATKRKGGGTVTISTRALENCYEVIIADDGVGFDPEEPQESPDAHIGIENVRTRLWSIIHGTLTITSGEGSEQLPPSEYPKRAYCHDEHGIVSVHRGNLNFPLSSDKWFQNYYFFSRLFREK